MSGMYETPHEFDALQEDPHGPAPQEPTGEPDDLALSAEDEERIRRQAQSYNPHSFPNDRFDMLRVLAALDQARAEQDKAQDLSRRLLARLETDPSVAANQVAAIVAGIAATESEAEAELAAHPVRLTADQAETVLDALLSGDGPGSPEWEQAVAVLSPEASTE